MKKKLVLTVEKGNVQETLDYLLAAHMGITVEELRNEKFRERNVVLLTSVLKRLNNTKTKVLIAEDK